MGKTILIVEDEQNIVDILSFNLSREGYDTLEAYDGKTGLQLALEQNPDLILLDLMLPEMNGFDVCRKLREAGSSVPILMLTAREEETDKVPPGPGAGGGRLRGQALLSARADDARGRGASPCTGSRFRRERSRNCPHRKHAGGLYRPPGDHRRGRRWSCRPRSMTCWCTWPRTRTLP